VPWPLPSFGGLLETQFLASVGCRFRSGCAKSTPVSKTATLMPAPRFVEPENGRSALIRSTPAGKVSEKAQTRRSGLTKATRGSLRKA